MEAFHKASKSCDQTTRARRWNSHWGWTRGSSRAICIEGTALPPQTLICHRESLKFAMSGQVPYTSIYTRLHPANGCIPPMCVSSFDSSIAHVLSQAICTRSLYTTERLGRGMCEAFGRYPCRHLHCHNVGGSCWMVLVLSALRSGLKKICHHGATAASLSHSPLVSVRFCFIC